MSAHGRRCSRETKETTVDVTLVIDGTGTTEVATGIPFFDHMLEQLGKHAGFDLTIDADGDLEVDLHHTVEDVGIVLGNALREALGDKAGVRRFANALVPLDEALVQVALDLSGRPFLVYDVDPVSEWIGTFDPQLAEEFWKGFVDGARVTLHLRSISGKNGHHVIEASFKGVARALRDAVRVEGTGVPSTKGTLVARDDCAVVDYGIGNLRSAEKALAAPRCRRARSRPTPTRSRAADAVVLPGVGNFGACMRALRDAGLEAGGEGSGDRRPAVPRRLRRDADAVRGQRRVARRCRVSASSRVESRGFPDTVRLPQIGWNTLEVRAGQPARAPGSAPTRGCTSCTRTRPNRPTTTVVAAWCDVRPSLRGRDRGGPAVGDAVPPREEQRRAGCGCWRTSSRPPRLTDGPVSRRSTCAAAASCSCNRATTTARRSTATTPSRSRSASRRRARAGSTSSTSTRRARATRRIVTSIAAICAAVDVQGADAVAACRGTAPQRRCSRRGVERVVVGTAAVERPELVDELARALPAAASRSGSTRVAATSRPTAGRPRPGVDLSSSRAASTAPAWARSSSPRSRATACCEGPDLEQLAAVLARRAACR